MKRVVSVLLAAGCLPWSVGQANETAKHVDLYTLPQAVGLPDEQVARVLAVPRPQKFKVDFNGLYDAKGREIRVRKFPVKAVTNNELVLAPGVYSVVVECRRYAHILTPKVGVAKIDTAAGQTYHAWCEEENWASTIVRHELAPARHHREFRHAATMMAIA